MKKDNYQNRFGLRSKLPYEGLVPLHVLHLENEIILSEKQLWLHTRHTQCGNSM